MAIDYEIYEQKCKEIRDTNNIHLDKFEKRLLNQGLSKRTVDNHINNFDFYING